MAELHTIESSTQDDLIAGLNRGDMRTVLLDMEHDKTYKRGEVICSENGINASKYVDDDTSGSTVFGIIAEDKAFDVDDNRIVVYVDGEFNRKLVYERTGVDLEHLETLDLPLRKVGIILRDPH